MCFLKDKINNLELELQKIALKILVLASEGIKIENAQKTLWVAVWNFQDKASNQHWWIFQVFLSQIHPTTDNKIQKTLALLIK